VNLRLPRESDIADYARWSDPNLKAWQTDGPWYNDDVGDLADRCRQRLARGQEPPHRRLEIETSDGAHIGWVVFYFRENDPHVSEVGIDIVEDRFWGRGLGSEALALWIDYLFPAWNLHRLGFSTWSGNPAMIRVGEKLGFRREARIRDGCRVNDRFHDRVKLGILRSEWERQEEEPK
jgi:RimJ/RimL family protein N-acetyltransferase